MQFWSGSPPLPQDIDAGREYANPLTNTGNGPGPSMLAWPLSSESPQSDGKDRASAFREPQLDARNKASAFTRLSLEGSGHQDENRIKNKATERETKQRSRKQNLGHERSGLDKSLG